MKTYLIPDQQFSRSIIVAILFLVLSGGISHAQLKLPVTHLHFNDDSSKLQFAIISDLWGGYRSGVFEEAVEKLELLQPQFVMSVGDLIDGKVYDSKVLDEQWNEFNVQVNSLSMPFFYVPGNHDISNPWMEKEWKSRLGRSYYYFTNNNVLFLCINTQDGGSSSISPEQIAYFKQAIGDNPEVRWTFVFMHRPVWRGEDGNQEGYEKIQAELAGRNYTLFSGHSHTYLKNIKDGNNHYSLSTTGGGSDLQGEKFGKFDHITWVTLNTGEQPKIINLKLDGLVRDDITNEDNYPYANTLLAQDLSFSKAGHTFYPELPNPVATNTGEWSNIAKAVNVSFASDNVRYPKEKVPLASIQNLWEETAWKGEKVHTQILVWTKEDINELSFQVKNLSGKNGSIIPDTNIKAAFVRYTMADDFGGGCADRDLSVDDSSLVADPIDIIDTIPVQANTVRPIWLSLQVPGDIPAGKYTGSIIINARESHELKISINVLDHILPPPAAWEYDFDIWQYPAPIARMHNVELWSEEHFELMKPYFTILANAGQKVISANIIEQPWGLDHVYFDDPSLIKWTRKWDGTWEFDFSLFDRYVSFVMACGINQRINCYSMITWDLSFIFYDEAIGKYQSIILTPGTDEYTTYWSGMIREFTRHLKEKGWFSKTVMAVDERPLESMQAIIALLKEIDPDWKIALAGVYHPEIEEDIYDYSLASYLKFDDAALKQRRAQGKPSTFYTACVEEYPTGYTFSPPAENAFLGWHAAAKGYSGYLFWAFNTWVENPLQNARWRRYPAGTLFQFYPGPRTSIRFEKLIEGIQDFEKIRILRAEFLKNGDKKSLKKLNFALSLIKIEKLDKVPAAEMLEEAKEILDQL